MVDIINEMGSNQILLDHFIGSAIEAEADALCDGEEVYILGIMQHIEAAGIHSGDSYAVLPPYNLGDFVMTQIEDITKKIALALETVGLINIQFAIKDDRVYVIEANPRASRTVPFIAKAYDEPYVNYATKIMLGEKKVKDFFNIGLKLGFFKVVGNQDDQLIYESCNPDSATSNTVLLNEDKKQQPVQQPSTAAPVGNKVTSGWSNPFGGTSWGK